MSSPSLHLDVQPQRDRVVVVVRGELDHFSSPELRGLLAELVGSGWREVVLDLRHLEFMDAGGVHLLKDLRDGALAAARFSMHDGVGPVALPLKMLGLGRLLPPAQDVEATSRRDGPA